MGGRTCMATPTNVFPRYGQPMELTTVHVYNESYGIDETFDGIMVSFTNQCDTLSYCRLELFDCNTDEKIYGSVWRFRSDDSFVIEHQKGVTVSYPIYNDGDNVRLISGRHYSYRLTLYTCLPDETGEWDDKPNVCVPYGSGIIQSINDRSNFIVDKGIKKLRAPSYWGDTGHLIGCTYMRIKNEERLVTAYDRKTGAVTVEHNFSSDVLSGDNIQYFLSCNFIESTGSESEGSYDFYMREPIKSKTTVYPTTAGLRTKSTYSQANNVGLENYRFKVYSMTDDTQIDGVVPTISSEMSKKLTNRTVIIQPNIDDNIVGKRITFTTEDESDYATINGYDKDTGLTTLSSDLNFIPTEGTAYTIYMGNIKLLDDSQSHFSYRLCYNFPVYALGQKFLIEKTLTSYEKQISNGVTKVYIPEPSLDSVISKHEVTINNTSQNVLIETKPTEMAVTGLTLKNIYYRRVKGESTWDYLGWNFGGHTTSMDSYIDYLAGNNHTYEYLIAPDLHMTSIVENESYDPSVEHKPYTISDVDIAWDGWTITAIYPFNPSTAERTPANIDSEELAKTSSNSIDIIDVLYYNKSPYTVGETWHFVSAIDSGSIEHNINQTIHVGTSTYPTVSRTNNMYQSGTFTTNLLSIVCPSGEIYDDIERVERWNRFITDDCLFILRSDKGDVWIISIIENTSRTYDESVPQILTNVSYSWVEVMSPKDLQIIQSE